MVMIKRFLKALILPKDEPLTEVKEEKRYAHLADEHNYALLFPDTEDKVQSGEPALMCCVCKDLQTNEVRLVPYAQYGVIFHKDQEINTQSKKGLERQYLSINMEWD